MIETAFCVTGWHFSEDFYQSLADLSEVEVYIISHKKKSEIPQFLFKFFEKENILIRPNIGYDWGCYQQFLQSDIWRDYETVFFMHDDIKIRDFGFVASSISLLMNMQLLVMEKGKELLVIRESSFIPMLTRILPGNRIHILSLTQRSGDHFSPQKEKCWKGFNLLRFIGIRLR